MRRRDSMILWVIAVVITCAVKPLVGVDDSNGQIVCDHGPLNGHKIYNGQRCWIAPTAPLMIRMDSLIVEGTLEVGDSITGAAPAPRVIKLINNFNVTSTGVVTADGKGFVSGGLGVGNSLGSGGSHGGRGGRSSSRWLHANEAYPYDRVRFPTLPGSSGGGGSGAGAGGGVIQIIAGKAVRIDGIVTAAGSKASALNRGGGAGGSVRTQSQYCHGKGRISVQGGNGFGRGGGGAGGRIAIECGRIDYTGHLFTHGGFSIGDASCPSDGPATTINSYAGTVTHSTNRGFLTTIRSSYSTSVRDRQWTVGNCAFSALSSLTCVETGYVNSYRGAFNFDCVRSYGPGYALSGMRSSFSSSYKDRRWRYTCCKMPRTDWIVSDCAETPMNSVRNALSWNAPASTIDKTVVATGIYSLFDSSYNDRRWKVRYCTLRQNHLPISSTTASSGIASRGVLGSGTNYWSPSNTANQRLTFSFSGGSKYVTGVTVRGRPDSSYFVSSLELEFSLEQVSSEFGQETNSGEIYVYKKLRSEITGYSFSGNENGYSSKYIELPYPILAKTITFKPLTWNGRIALAAAVHGYSPAGGVTGSLQPRPGGVCSENGGGNELTQGEYGGPGTALAIDIYGAKLLSDNMGLGPRLPLVYREPGGPCDKYNLEMSGAVAWVFDDPISVDNQPYWSNSTMLPTLNGIDEIKFSVGAQVAFKPSSLASGSSGGSASSITLEVTQMLGDDSTAAHFLNDINYVFRANNLMKVSTFVQSTPEALASLQLSSGLNRIEKTLVVDGKIAAHNSSRLEYGKRTGSKMTVYNPKSAAEATSIPINQFVIHSGSHVELMPNQTTYTPENNPDVIPPQFDGTSCGGVFFELVGENSRLEVGSASKFSSPCSCAFADGAYVVLNGILDCGTLGYHPSSAALRELHINSNGKLRFFPTLEQHTLSARNEIDVSGAIEFMSKPSGPGLSSTSVLNITCNEFYIRQGGSVRWRRNAYKQDRGLSVAAQRLVSIDGLFSAAGNETSTTFADAPALETFTVGRHGSATLTINGDLLADRFTVEGTLHLRNRVTFGGKYSRRARSIVVAGPSGSLRTETGQSLPSDQVTVINADDITVGGEVITGRLDPGVDGWRSLETLNQSKFEFYSTDGCPRRSNNTNDSNTLTSFYVEKVTVNGSMVVRGFIEFEPHPSAAEKMEYFVVGSKGNMMITEPDNTSSCAVRFNRIKAVDVTVAGLLDPLTLDISPGWDRLTVERGGTFVMTPASAYRIDKVTVNGNWYSRTALQLRGRVRSLTANIDVGSYGKFSVDHNRASLTADQWVSESTINAHQVAVNGQFHGGMLSTKRLQDEALSNDSLIFEGQEINQNGWDVFHIGQGGQAQFRMSETAKKTFPVDAISCNGSLTVYDTVKIIGKKGEMVEKIEIGPQGSFVLNSLPNRNMSNASLVYTAIMHINAGQFRSTDIELTTSWGWAKLVVEQGGKAYIHPKRALDQKWGLFPLNYLTVDGSGSVVQFFDHVQLSGRNRTALVATALLSGGTLLLMRDQSDDCLVNGTCLESKLHCENVTVSGGRLDAGYLSIGSGWLNLHVRSAGVVTVMSSKQANQAFPIDHVEVTGSNSVFEARNWGRIFGSTSPRTRLVDVGSGGLLALDTNDLADQRKKENGVCPDHCSTPSSILVQVVLLDGQIKSPSLVMDAFLVNVTANGLLNMEYGGDVSECGAGFGNSYASGASGASHGGRGGRHLHNSAPLPNSPFGDIFSIGACGSGGGTGSSSGGGGRGGGRLELNATDTINFSGRITVNGRSATTSSSGGGSGGSVWIKTFRLSGPGYISANGGAGNSNGGGGSGGRVNIYANTGDFRTGHIINTGGRGGNSNAEPGGPGTSYYQSDTDRVLRIDNGCQKASVALPSGTRATDEIFYEFYSSGAIAILNKRSDSKPHDFTMIEIYGGAHLSLENDTTVGLPSNQSNTPKQTFSLVTERIAGDDTGHLHVPPGISVHWTQVETYRFANMTVMPVIYEGALLKLPSAVVEFRPAFHEYTFNSKACPVSLLTGTPNSNSRTFKMWGTLDATDAHLLIGSGATLSLQLPHVRRLSAVGITIQRNAVFQLNSLEGLENNLWKVELLNRSGDNDYRKGALTVEGGGLLSVRALSLNAHLVTVDINGHLSADGKGNATGLGAGISIGKVAVGGSHGGKGGRTDDTDQNAGLNTPATSAPVYGSIEEPQAFGSGGSPNLGVSSASGGVGGGLIKIKASVVTVEGKISADGTGASRGGGGSGGSILINATQLEGHGSITSNGGSASCSLICGGGSGGRIALHFTNDLRWWNGKVTAYGGPGSSVGVYGGAGTVFYKMKRLSGLQSNWLEAKNNRGSLTTTSIEDGLTPLALPSTTHNITQRKRRNADVTPMTFTRMSITEGSRLALRRDFVHLSVQYLLSGDFSGWLHIQSGQTFVVGSYSDVSPYERKSYFRYEYGELRTNVIVHEGGYLILPPETTCRGVTILVHGTIAIRDFTVASGCKLRLGPTGTSRILSGTNSSDTNVEGIEPGQGRYTFVSLFVGDGGEVSAIPNAPDLENNLTITALDTMRVYGGGRLHAVSVNLTAHKLIVDDLGVITGDLHLISCHGDPHTTSTVKNGQDLVLTGSGKNGPGASGAGHGGRGGRGSNQFHTGGAYGSLFEPKTHGCSGGSDGQSSGGKGGGNIVFKVTGTLQIDGLVQANGENAPNGGAGGGSGGSIVMHANNMRGYGDVTVNGGNGFATSSSRSGGGGAAGRIAVYFSSNKTYSGSWQAHGGKPGNVIRGYVSPDTTTGYGGPGTMFFYHLVHKHTTLILNNNGHGPDKDSNFIDNYEDLTHDESRAWFLPSHLEHVLSGTSHSFYFDEIQIWGKAHLAVAPLPDNDPQKNATGNSTKTGPETTIFYKNMIGDRTGSMHIGPLQSMDLERPYIDLPFSAHVYKLGHLGLAPVTHVHGVTIWLSGALTHVRNITVRRHGRLWLNRDGRTASKYDINDTFYNPELDDEEYAGKYTFDFVHVQDTGYIHMINDPTKDPGTEFRVLDLTVDGGGLVEATHFYVHAVNVTIDAGGLVSANSQGYSVTHGQPVRTNGSLNIGIHGIINPGIGYSSSSYSSSSTPSGAGHGGSGGHGRGTGVLNTGQPYGDLYQPEAFGSAGGGPAGGRGGGRIWLNITGKIHIDGTVSADGAAAGSHSHGGGGGSGGSIWLHTNIFSGDGVVSANGGRGAPNGNGGGGAGGRIAVYMDKNITFGVFTFHAHGGRCQKVSSTSTTPTCEVGGPGTTFIYHTKEKHRTLRVENGGASIGTRKLFAKPRNKLVHWENLAIDGGRAWILAANSGGHKFANFRHDFHFEELQIYGGAHLAVMDPDKIPVDQIWRYQVTVFTTRTRTQRGDEHNSTATSSSSPSPSTTATPAFVYESTDSPLSVQPLTTALIAADGYSTTTIPQLPGKVTIHFRFFLGDRSGAIHVGNEQTMDLERPEIDVPFSSYVYHGGYLGLAPITVIHGVEIWVSGVMDHVRNMTVKLKGNATLNHDGRTALLRKLHDGGMAVKDVDPQSLVDTGVYVFNQVRILNTGLVQLISDPVQHSDGIDFFANLLFIEGGGIMRASRVMIDVHNATVDSGGLLTTTGMGYADNHEYSQNSIVNIGAPPLPGNVNLGGAGAGHGGSGGRVISHSTKTVSTPSTIDSQPNYHKRILVDIMRSGLSHGNLYKPTSYGSTGGSGYGNNGKGGRGGGVIRMLVSNTLEVDGLISSDGVAPERAKSGAGGGSGGSIWIHCSMLTGFGSVSSNGGDGAHYDNANSNRLSGGGGGGGGRIAIYFVTNTTLFGFRVHSRGGKGGETRSPTSRPPVGENGGAGTSILYHMIHRHRTLLIDNGGLKPFDLAHLIGDPNPAMNNPEDRVTNGRSNDETAGVTTSISDDGCRTWIIPPPDFVDDQDGAATANQSDVALRYGTGGNPVFDYRFEELQIYGHAHLAISTVPLHNASSDSLTELVASIADSPAEVDIHFRFMIGDRTGTVHLRANQSLDLRRDEIDLPFNVRAYTHSFLGLAPITIIHGVTVWMHGALAHIERLTLRFFGVLSMESGGHTHRDPPNNFRINTIRIQDDAVVYAVTSPVFTNPLMKIDTTDLKVEGGGKLHVTMATLTSQNVTVEDGGAIRADGTGYSIYDHSNSALGINLGKGHSHDLGSSGAGHGGTSGTGKHQIKTGQPYGDLYEPRVFGSAGGTSSYLPATNERYYVPGGRGGGVLYLNVSDTLSVNGEITADGKAPAEGHHAGGGSGGSILIHTNRFTGFGRIAIHGGNGSGDGGAGAGGRIGVYLRDNSTFIGRFYSSGGVASGAGESGGPGTAFIFHVGHQHRTLIVDNNKRTSNRVGKILSYKDTSTDSFKAWVMPDALGHQLASRQPNFDPTPEHGVDFVDGRLELSFEEFQIYGNAHLAIMRPHGANLSHVNATRKEEIFMHFKDMIGDRSGVVHAGPQQDFDLKRHTIDTPFSTYVYVDGHLGLATHTRLESVFIHLEGNMSHVQELTMTRNAQLRLFLTGSAALAGYHSQKARLNFTADVRLKDTSSIIANGPPTHATQYEIISKTLTVDGGAYIGAKHIYLEAINMTVDDGGHISVNNGGHTNGDGPAPGTAHFLGHSGASHGGMGGRGGCEGYVGCRLPRNSPYGSMYVPKTFGSGGYGNQGGTGGGVMRINVHDTLRVDGTVSANSENVPSGSSGSSGGSGGSLLINTRVLTGAWTGEEALNLLHDGGVARMAGNCRSKTAM